MVDESLVCWHIEQPGAFGHEQKVAHAPEARATGDRRTGWQPAQPVLTAVSSTTNEVCSEESSVPENLMVTDPVRPPSE